MRNHPISEEDIIQIAQDIYDDKGPENRYVNEDAFEYLVTHTAFYEDWVNSLNEEGIDYLEDDDFMDDITITIGEIADEWNRIKENDE